MSCEFLWRRKTSGNEIRFIAQPIQTSDKKVGQLGLADQLNYYRLKPVESIQTPSRLKIQQKSTEILTRTSVDYQHCQCILKSSPKGEGFSLRVRQ